MGLQSIDRIITNVLVQDLDNPVRPAAVVVDNGQIIDICDVEHVRAIKGHGTDVIDGHGHVLLPAMTDSHTHFKRASVLMEYFLDFDQLLPRSIADVQAAVTDAASRTEQGDWVQGDSLNPQRLTEGRFPNRHELDAAAPDVPVVLRGVGRHIAAVNSAALALGGIDRTTPDPEGGRIERDADGEPLGILHENAKLRLDANAADTVIPPISREQRLHALRTGIARLHRYGIAAVHEIPREPEQISDWLELRELDGPSIRVRFYIRGLAAQTKLEYLTGLGIRGGLGDDWIRIGGVKFSLDGSETHRNAMVYEDYDGDPGNRGLQRIDTEEFFAAVATAHASNLQIAVHAIGQRAVDMALDAYAAAAEGDPSVKQARHRIEHAYLPPVDGQLARMRELGVVLSTQPSFIEAVGDAWTEVFGDETLPGSVPIASALAQGVHVQINSDFPCSRLEPFVGIATAVTRRTRDGRTLGTDEAIDLRTAFHLMTRAPAWTAFEEERRGRLELGHLADLMLLEADPLALPVDELVDLPVAATFVGGEPVHSTLH